MTPSLYMVSNLGLALEIKMREGCPHIHCRIEPDCDEFTANIVWFDVVDKGIDSARAHGACVISIEEVRHPSGKLSQEELLILSNWDRALKKKMEGVEVHDDL